MQINRWYAQPQMFELFIGDRQNVHIVVKYHLSSLKCVYSFIVNVNFYSKMPKNQYLRLHWQKISTASLKIA